MGFRYRLGRLVAELQGEGPLAAMVAEEVPEQMVDRTSDPVDVTFEFGTFVEPSGPSVHLGQYRIGKQWLASNDKYLPHLIVREGERVHVTIDYKIGIIGARGVARLLAPIDIAFDDVWRRLSRRFYYLIFIQVVQWIQLSKGQTFCHSSACSNGHETLMLMAWGGIGKTSSLIRLLHSSEDWRFISDDQAILDDAGIVHRTPLKMQLYPYNLQGEPMLNQALMRNRSILDRLQWSTRHRLLGSKRVLRRVHAESIFGDGKGLAQAPVTRVFFLRRANVSEFTEHGLAVSDLAAQMARIVQYELRSLWLMLLAMDSAGPATEGYGFGVDSVAAARMVEDIVKAALERVPNPPLVLDVPLGARPADLEQAVLARIGTG